MNLEAKTGEEVITKVQTEVRKTRLPQMIRPGLAALLALLTVSVGADELNMPPGVTDISQSVYDLHMFIFWICVAIGTVVFGAMFWSVIHHRKAAGHKAGSVPREHQARDRLDPGTNADPHCVCLAGNTDAGRHV